MNDLYQIFSRYPDTDKDGPRPQGLHSYSEVYERLLLPIRSTVKRVLEMGVRRGGSLKSWVDYFPNLELCVGGDNGSEAGLWVPDREKIAICYADSGKPETLHSLGERFGSFNVIWDDACHKPYHQIATFAALRPYLASGGIYICEDVEDVSYALHFQEMFGGEVYDLRANKGRHDDILWVYRSDV